MNKLINIRNKLDEQLTNTSVILKWKKRKGGTINIQFDTPNDPISTYAHEHIMQICPSNSYCWFRNEKEIFGIRRYRLQITFNIICDCYKIFTKLDKLNTNILLKYDPCAVEIKFTDFNELDKIINSMGIKM